jgi:hypothetical protein
MASFRRSMHWMIPSGHLESYRRSPAGYRRCAMPVFLRRRKRQCSVTLLPTYSEAPALPRDSVSVSASTTGGINILFLRRRNFPGANVTRDLYRLWCSGTIERILNYNKLLGVSKVFRMVCIATVLYRQTHLGLYEAQPALETPGIIRIWKFGSLDCALCCQAQSSATHCQVHKFNKVPKAHMRALP